MVNPALLAALLAAGPELADSVSPPVRSVTLDAQQVAAQSFGLDSQYMVIPASAFDPDRYDVQYFRRGPDGYRGVTGVVPNDPWGFGAPLELPNGALIESICFLLYDVSDTADIRVSVWRAEVDATPDDVQLVSNSPTNDGFFTECFEWAPPFLRFRSFANLDGDPLAGFLLWELRIRLTATVQQAFRGAFVKFRHGVSPAPATPTYDDVLPGQLIYPYVEAMTAAGITIGCGSDNFCPNDPVTRGQFALMLGRALGLHWPF